MCRVHSCTTFLTPGDADIPMVILKTCVQRQHEVNGRNPLNMHIYHSVSIGKVYKVPGKKYVGWQWAGRN